MIFYSKSRLVSWKWTQKEKTEALRKHTNIISTANYVSCMAPRLAAAPGSTGQRLNFHFIRTGFQWQILRLQLDTGTYGRFLIIFDLSVFCSIIENY